MRFLGFLSSLLLTVAVVAAGWDYAVETRAASKIAHETAVILQVERLLSTLKDAETGQRGFLLTGEEPYLEPYTAALARVEEDIAAVQALLGPSSEPLLADARARLASAASGIATFKKGGFDAATRAVRNGTGKLLMDRIRDQVATVQKSSEATIKGATHRLEGWTLLLRGVSMLATLLAFGGILMIAMKRRREQRASNALLEGVLENAPVGLGFLDSSLRVRHVNRAFAEMSGLAASFIPGRPFGEVMPHLRDALEPRVRQVIEQGRPVSALEVKASGSTEPSRDSQGNDYQVSLYPLESMGPTRSDSTASHGAAGIVITDITSRKRAERRMRESEERFRTVTRSSASIIWVADPTGAFGYPQPEWVAFTGQDPEASLGWGWIDAVHPDDRMITKDSWETALSSKAIMAIEHRLRRADALWRHMAVNAAPILDEQGNVREWVGTHTDITDRKEAELELAAAKEAAEAANRSKSVFLANMSHELRTPLSAVIGYSEMLEEEVEELGEKRLLSDLGKIKTNARHLLSLINDVLDLSKIEANRMDVHAEDVDVAGLATEVASTVEALIRQKNNTLELELGANLGSMHTDVVKLRQCLFNLLSNAAKFTENGRIVLSVERTVEPTREWLDFRVTDNGIGMTPEQLQRLFLRFSQADETTTRRFGGTGLGLAISRAFSRLMGGDISVESKQGEITSFTLRLPVHMPDHLTVDLSDHVSTHDELEGSVTRELVLVIDDDASQRDLMSRFLKRLNFNVEVADNGRRGLDLARTLKPRAILLDVMMPQMDGWSVLSALKADPDLAGVPVVMITFVSDNGLAASLGAEEQLAKPVDWETLKTVMDRFHDHDGDVLVVDDDRSARERLRTVLERNGWTVQEAANGAEALERVNIARPRLILLDLTMPVMDGFSFLHALRRTPDGAEIPVVVLSARDITQAERGQLQSAERVLSKGQTSLKTIADELRQIEHAHYSIAAEEVRK